MRHRAELLRLHQPHRTAHLDKRADQMVASFDASVRFGAAGELTVMSRAENQARLQAYFDRSTFQAWDDIAPPILRISPDGRMADPIVQKRVTLTVAIASTDRPGP